MKNAMQLKAIIKNKEKNISAQLVMQNFMLERLLERISVSEYKQSFILKGGFLIAAMVGRDTRETMDMDATKDIFTLLHEYFKNTRLEPFSNYVHSIYSNIEMTQFMKKNYDDAASTMKDMLW